MQAFRRVADAMAWQILTMNKVLIRSTNTTHDHHGYLRDTNVESAVDAIKQLQKPGEFYLINDLTACLGAAAGDLTHVDVNRRCAFVELKTGEQNVRVMKFLDGLSELRKKQRHGPANERTQPTEKRTCEIGEFLNAHREFFVDKGKWKQVDRVLRQMSRMQAVLEYDRLNEGEDLSLTAKGKPTGRRRIAHVPKTQDEHAFSEIRASLSNISQSAPFYSLLRCADFLTFLFTDNQLSYLFLSNLSPFVRLMNAKHVIYHEIHQNLQDCGYRKGPAEGGQEFVTYSQLLVLDWTGQVLRDSSLMPPFLMGIEHDLLFDLLFGRKSIYVNFDRQKFAEYVTEASEGRVRLSATGTIDRDWAGLEMSVPVGKKRKHAGMLGWGLVFRMIIEFQEPETVVKQLIEMVESDKEDGPRAEP